MASIVREEPFILFCWCHTGEAESLVLAAFCYHERRARLTWEPMERRAGLKEGSDTEDTT